jgi:CheY-like chemotaxis protein
MNPKRVLIVDDNAFILKSFSMVLSAHGYHPLMARDGGEAACLVARERPELVLLDINFPPDVGHGGGVPWDGFLIMDWLRRMEEARQKNKRVTSQHLTIEA